MDLPPYAFGHEPIGVRFGLAWRALSNSQDYFHVPGGYLVDLLNESTLTVLLALGIRPEADFARALKMFSWAGVFLHAALMSGLSFYVILSKRMTFVAKVAVLVVGATLGYGYFWAPNRLFFPDYHLTLNVLAYSLVIIGARFLDPDVPRLTSWRLLGWACLVAAFLFLKLSLLPWVLLAIALVAVGDDGSRSRLRSIEAILGAAAVLLLLLAVLWVRLQPRLLAVFAYDTARFLLTVKGVEPAFEGLSDFLGPGTVYWPVLWVVGVWVLVVGISLVTSRRREVPAIALLGGALYAYMLSRRPGDTMVPEIVAFISVSGMLCALSLVEWTRTLTVGLWSVVLVLQAITVIFTGLPASINGARLSARIAGEVDAYVKGSGLDVVYFVRDESGLYQSAATAAFKAGLTCGYDRPCSPTKRAAIVSSLARPYRFVLASEAFAEPDGPFLLLYVDEVGEKSGRQLTSEAGRLVESAVECRVWQQHAKTIHLCRVAGPLQAR